MVETTGRQVIISILIFVIITTGAFVLIGNSLQDNSQTDFQEFNKSFAKFESIKEKSDLIGERVNPNETPTTFGGIFGIFEGVTKNIYGTFALLFEGVGSIGVILNDVSLHFGLPTWLTGGLLSIIILSLTFAIAAAVFKWHI